MLKNKVKNLELQMYRIMASKKNGIYFVVIEDGEYKAQAAGYSYLVFQGSESDYNQFVKRCGEQSVFIIDDIEDDKSRGCNGHSNIFDWIH